jgi:hypothetical protein
MKARVSLPAGLGSSVPPAPPRGEEAEVKALFRSERLSSRIH